MWALCVVFALAAAGPSLEEQIRGLRKVPDAERGAVTRRLAQGVRQLPDGARKRQLATDLAYLVTEGDFGSQTLQDVADTLAGALRGQPDSHSQSSYSTLAQLARYENVRVSLDAPAYTAALAQLEADDRARASADFTLRDLNGAAWTLSKLRGKAVLVNFWATWCPPCRKEMPDLQALADQFQKDELVVLAITDEDRGKVSEFLTQHPVRYTILLDPGRKVNDRFAVNGIPKSFLYDREGKLVATAIDMRTRRQFLDMLAKAGLR